MNKIIAGKRAKHNGNYFENFLKSCAYRDKWEVLQIPNGCKTLGKNNLIRIPSPFDFVFCKNQKAIFADAKTTERSTFSRSQINVNQSFSLSRLEAQGFIAGYIVRFSKQKEVFFFSAAILSGLKPQESLSPKDGVFIGNDIHIHLDVLAKFFTSDES